MTKKLNAVRAKTKTHKPKSSLDTMGKIVESARKGQLVVVVGTGVSMGLTNNAVPSWSGLIKSGFAYAHKKGRVSDTQLATWGNLLNASDMDELLGAAEFIGRKLGAPDDQVYGRWLEEIFAYVQPSNAHLIAAFKAIASQGIPICTLNYDPLLETVTGLSSIRISETQKVLSWMRRESPSILHLHGSWDVPSSCVLGIRDYEATQSNEVRDLVQRALASFKHLLFIGCGDTFADPNFSALVMWLRTKLQALTPQHIALTLENDVALRHSDPAWVGFVEPLSFGKAHDALPAFLLKHFPQASSKRTVRNKDAVSNEANTVLDAYRSFLLRDCGQMTIEGVSADLDTGQRKFDLERLFVPLNVAACPPEYLPTDPEAAIKLEKWQKENSEAIPFGKALANNKRLALLALPGGGKTLLLKRLAVAYADPMRRNASTDELPDLQLLPVLIRCREWRDHIQLPILTLLKNIGDITGQPELTGLSAALVPLLKKGQVLLLVDGLDEIHNNADRTTFVDHLESFLDQYKQTRIVVTSREAGFNLVAPTLSRFCERWRLAPLAADAIELLCGHWHLLMAGDTPTAIAEGKEVAGTLIRNGSLRRLAENPLLLTMLLVVKHGAGGLPPDRVSLYGRAIDVLLDTWNIKGHDPLNAKEAVPQLAYVAFQLMCAGKQTATERELLELLQEAREKHPNIKRYAKDSPYEFLKRVELRSSLLLEVGHQLEGGRTVPFYQFRHLTFQEYLAAVAVTEGHYQQFHQDDTVLTPLENYLEAEEWKEVIPMAAVLARKRAEPLLVKLISLGNSARSADEHEVVTEQKHVSSDKKLGGATGRLLQCFVEEAEASPQTISSALQLISFFAHGCQTADDWESLSRGPYGEELYSQAWGLLVSIGQYRGSWLLNTCAGIAAFRKPLDHWISQDGNIEIELLLQSEKKEDISRGLLIAMGILWNWSRLDPMNRDIGEAIPLEQIEPHLFHEDSVIRSAATWAWTNGRKRQKAQKPVSVAILNNFFKHWQGDGSDRATGLAGYAMSCQLGVDRDLWTPNLTKTEIRKIRERFDASGESNPEFVHYEKFACFFIAYHAKSIWNDAELRSHFNKLAGLQRIEILGGKLDGVRKALGIKSTTKKVLEK
jgi:hypothetical protein